MYMFMQNFTKVSAAVHELSWSQREKLGRKQYSPSLPRTVMINKIMRVLYFNRSSVTACSIDIYRAINIIVRPSL